MKRLEDLHNDFIKRLNLIYCETIEPFLKEDNIYGPTERELINVEFCYTFIHSALEGYVESICDLHYRIMKNFFDKNNIINNCMSSILLLYDGKIQENYQYNSDFIKDAIEISFTKLKHKLSNNHGVSKKYLIEMLPYVGLDIPNDRLVNAIDAIAQTRGEFAHNLKVKIQKTAGDAFLACEDALVFAEMLYKNARQEYDLYKKITK